jgi:hypothetical protein
MEVIEAVKKEGMRRWGLVRLYGSYLLVRRTIHIDKTEGLRSKTQSRLLIRRGLGMLSTGRGSGRENETKGRENALSFEGYYDLAVRLVHYVNLLRMHKERHLAQAGD